MLKRRRYDGSDTVITRYWTKEEAQDDADLLNKAYQSEQYYTERYDADKAADFFNQELVNKLAQKIGSV